MFTSVGNETRSRRSVEISGYPLESRIDGPICNNKRIAMQMTAEKVH